MKKVHRALAVLLGVTLLGCGCGNSQSTPSDNGEASSSVKAKESKEEFAAHAKEAKLDMIDPSAYADVSGLELESKTYISVIGKSDSEEFWNQVKAGAKAAGADLNKELGYDGSDKIKVVYSGPAKSNDVDAQVNLLDQELDRYPAALAIAMVDSQSCNVQFDLAIQNGIPLVTFDSVGSYKDVMAHVACDNDKAAKEAAARTAEAMGETGKILIIGHDSKSVTTRSRTESFVAEIEANHTDISVSETYYLDQMDEIKTTLIREYLAGEYVPEYELDLPDEEEAEDEADSSIEADSTIDVAVEDEEGEIAVSQEQLDAVTEEQMLDYIFAKNPDITAIYATNASSVITMLETTERLEKEDLIITGFDGNEEQLKAVEEGKISGLIVQNAYGMGYATVIAEARSALGMANEAIIDTGYAWVTPENISDKEMKYFLYSE